MIGIKKMKNKSAGFFDFTDDDIINSLDLTYEEQCFIFGKPIAEQLKLPKNYLDEVTFVVSRIDTDTRTIYIKEKKNENS